MRRMSPGIRQVLHTYTSWSCFADENFVARCRMFSGKDNVPGTESLSRYVAWSCFADKDSISTGQPGGRCMSYLELFVVETNICK